MAKSFKEIGKKAEVLIEQGMEADQKVQSCQARVAFSNSRVAAARRQLAAVSETDEEGNPIGDVESAWAQLRIEENLLAANQRALSSAQNESDQVRQAKHTHIQEIEKHNQVERSNLEKLRRLRLGAFGADSVALTEGMAERLNEAEDARVELLRSMGIEATPEYVNVGVDGKPDSGWHGGGFSTIDTTGQAHSYQGGGEGLALSGGIATPIGGGLVSNSFALDESLQDTDSVLANNSDESSDLFSEQIKVLKLSPEERRQRGQGYIDKILGEYKKELLDKGVVSVSALDATIDELKQFYLSELEKDILGQPNELYSDPNYDELIEIINRRRPPIANVLPGSNMSFEAADSGHVNPNYGKAFGYSINCQSCVVVFEARERGYNVQVLPCTKGSALDVLSHDTRMAWIDPRTGKHPEYIYDNSLRTPEKYLDFVDNVVKSGSRYTIQFAWKGRGHSGHIVNIDRTPNGLLRIKDNQRGPGEKSEWIGDIAVLEYLSRMKYEDKSIFGKATPCVPQLLRIDNMDFDFSIVNHIMKGAENGASIS